MDILRLAKPISIIFQPIFIPLYTLLLMYFFNNEMNLYHTDTVIYKTSIWLVLLMIVAPFLCFIILYKLKIISDVNLSIRKERVLPTFIGIFFSMLFYFVCWKYLPLHMYILDIILFSIIALTIANFITTKWKISIHSLGVGTMLGAYLVLQIHTKEYNYWFTLILVAIALLVMISRLILKRHTKGQVIAGFSLGLLILLSTYIIL